MESKLWQFPQILELLNGLVAAADYGGKREFKEGMRKRFEAQAKLTSFLDGEKGKDGRYPRGF